MNAIATFMAMLPFLLAILLANLAEKDRSIRILALLYLVFLNGMIAVIGLLSLAAAGMLASEAFVGALQRQNPGMDVAQLRSTRWDVAGMVLVAASAVAMAALLPPVRRWAAQWLPIQADNAVHTTALSMTATAFGLNLFQMIALAPLLFATTATEEGVRRLQEQGGVSYLDVLVFPLLTLMLAALLGVGLYVRRNQEEALARLGLAPLSLPQLGIVVGCTGLMLALAVLTERAWEAVDPVGLRQVGGLSKALLGNFTGLVGAVAIGVSAAIGEEAFFRGAYQPRMGLVPTTLLFASFHVQYGITPATALVLVIGLILGILRQRTSLTVCILVHFLYNFVSVLLS